jgi:uncharacterized protein
VSGSWEIVGRRAEDLIAEALADTRVVTVNGARQAGKSRFVAGYVLYTGQQTLPYGDKLRAVPLDALWRLAP